MTTATTLFQGIGGSIDNATATFVNSASAHLITTITPWAITGVALYFTLYGYMIIAGKIQEPFSDFLIKCTKILIIGALALHTGTYLKWVVEAFRSLETSLTAVLSAGNSTTIYQSLDANLSKGMEIISQCVERAKSTSWMSLGTVIGWWFNAVLIAVGFAFVVVVGGIAVLLSTFMLKLAFAIGPLFIMCLMWPITAKFFDAWAEFVLNHILIVVLTTAVLMFSITIYGNEIAKVNIDDPDQSMMLVALELLIVAAILYALIKAVPTMAAALAGGLSMVVMGVGQMTGIASQSLHVTRGTAHTTQKASKVGWRLIKAGYNKLHSNSIQPSASQSNAYGGSQPAYRRAALDNIKRSNSVRRNT